ncbi:MAG: DinB family protein [Candidatus Kapabacteria bacterium]|nr:DinB family protein [Candidatus Kapabacteria bacterium]
MNANTEQETVAEILDRTRKLTRFYLSKLTDIDPLAQVTVGDQKLNSITWICAHLTWAEHELVINALGAEPLPISWLDLFTYGTSSEPQDTWPSMETIRKDFDEVHAAALAAIRSQTDLSEPSQISMFGPTSLKRDIVYHAIRHEGTHAGHLGWLCKLNSITTV